MIHEVYIDGVRYVPDTGLNVQTPRWTAALQDLEPANPTGAWGRSDGGIVASRGEVAYNRSRLPGTWYIPRVREVAGLFALPPALVMGIFDRESNHGRSLIAGYGDGGHGFGVGQVDGRYHTQLGTPDPYAKEHMGQCADILVNYIAQVQKKHAGWPDKYVLKGAVVAYNSGIRNVVTIQGMDRGTSGDDYGADVMARAQYWHHLLEGGRA